MNHLTLGKITKYLEMGASGNCFVVFGEITIDLGQGFLGCLKHPWFALAAWSLYQFNKWLHQGILLASEETFINLDCLLKFFLYQFCSMKNFSAFIHKYQHSLTLILLYVGTVGFWFIFFFQEILIFFQDSLHVYLSANLFFTFQFFCVSILVHKLFCHLSPVFVLWGFFLSIF